jgi:putative nucleotidyltransferase with HDIG domain
MLEPSLEEQELLADTFQRDRTGLTRAELTACLLDTVGLFTAVGLLVLASPPRGFSVAAAVASTVVLIVATRVQFDTPFGYTVPVQLGFVPLLFSVPVAIAPLVVAFSLAVARLPDVLAGSTRPSRLLQTAGNSWFSVGPAALFALSGTEPRHAGAGLLIAALAAQFGTDFAMSSLRYSAARGASLRSQLRETWVYGVDAALTGVALVVAANVHAHSLVPLALLPLLGLIALFARERHERLESLIELNNAYRGTALVLGDVVEADDGYTGEHCKSVVALALEVGEAMGLNAEQRRNLEFAALLHDVGKIAIPKEIVNKPGKLNPEEWTLIQTHTIEGQSMLDRVGGFMRDVGLVVRSHHERWDGKGYPDGLVGEEIPLGARIITCCDSWNAMRTNRPYRKALPATEALAELRANSGSQFDPDVVTALLAVIETSDAQLAPEGVGGPHAVGARREAEPGASLELGPLRQGVAPTSAAAPPA